MSRHDHTVQDVDFVANTCLCLCGWTGRPFDFSEHRHDVGIRGGAKIRAIEGYAMRNFNMKTPRR